MILRSFLKECLDNQSILISSTLTNPFMCYRFPKSRVLIPALFAFQVLLVTSGQSEISDKIEEVFTLNPFVVQGDSTGYLESNAVSGTSLKMAIRDLPMSLEVINNEFMTDLQATDLKEALAYSAGVYTQSYVDETGANEGGSVERSPSSVASVNNPFTNTVSIRGFAVPNQQRFGFRIGGVAVGEGFSSVLGGLTDTINTERLEVIRGPAALLYGVNVLSGVVNIIPKRPLNTFSGNFQASVGSEGFRRAGLDVTGPITKDRIHYRLMTSQEERNHHTSFQADRKEYYAGQLELLPVARMQILLEAQYGKFRRHGIGAQFFTDNLTGRPTASNPVNNFHFRTPFHENIQYGREDFNYLFERNENDPNDIFWIAKNLVYDGVDNPLPVMGDNFRVTGPDTYFEREEYSFMGLVTLQPVRGLDIEIGAFYTHAKEERFTVQPGVFTNRELFTITTPSDALTFPPFLRSDPGRANHWVRQPEVYTLLGGYPTSLPPTSRYGLDEAVGFSVAVADIPHFSLPTTIDSVTSGGLGEVFVVPDRVRRAQLPGTDWNTWNSKYARYFWVKTPTETDSIQLRGRAAYSFSSGFPFLGSDSITHTIIGGYQFTRDKLSIVSGMPPVEDVITSGPLHPVPGDVSLGWYDRDPYLLRSSVFDMTPIRYQGERLAIPGTLNTSSAKMGIPLTEYVEGRVEAEGSIRGWNIARSGWRDVTVDQTGIYGIYQAQFLNDKATFFMGIRNDGYQVEEVEQLRALAGTPSVVPAENHALTDMYFGMARYTTLPYLLGDGSVPYTPDRWIADLPDELNREIQREIDLFREAFGEQGTREKLFDRTQRFTTSSFGLSYRVTEALSVYAMYSEGVFPNQGQRDGLGKPIPAEQTSNREIGIKFDLLDRRISGSIAVYEIRRENATWQFNGAPSPRRWIGGAQGPSPAAVSEHREFGSFDARTALYGDGPEWEAIENAGFTTRATRPVSQANYQRFSYGVHESFFREAWRKHLGEEPPGTLNSQLLEANGLGFVQTTDMGVAGQFENAGRTEPYYWVDVSRDLEPGKYVNEDGVDLGQMVKEAFDNALQAKTFDGNPIHYGDNDRTAAFGAGNNPSNVTGDLVTFSDKTQGIDGQIFLRPAPNYQVILSASYQNRGITGNGFNLVPLVDPQTGEHVPGTKYDRWVFILGEENFTDPSDPTTFTGEGIKGIDLSFVPRWNLSVWNRYDFTEGPLGGLGLGFGVRYFGSAPTSVPVGGTSLRENSFPTPPTKQRTLVDASLYYSWTMWDLPWRLSLNIYNVLNKTRFEQLIRYENEFDPSSPQFRRSVTRVPPRSFRLSVSTQF